MKYLCFIIPPSPIYRPVVKLPFQNIKKTHTFFFFSYRTPPLIRYLMISFFVIRLFISSYAVSR